MKLLNSSPIVSTVWWEVMSNQTGTCSDKHKFWLENVRCPTTISSTGAAESIKGSCERRRGAQQIRNSCVRDFPNFSKKTPKELHVTKLGKVHSQDFTGEVKVSTVSLN